MRALLVSYSNIKMVSAMCVVCVKGMFSRLTEHPGKKSNAVQFV